MCKLSYEKCVCFIFLVIVAFLSCSGFRIDKLAMTDISKRNTYTSSNLVLRSNELFSGIFENSRYKRTPYDNNPETSTTRNAHFSKRQSQRPHKIRHARKQKLHGETQAPHFESNRTPPPRGWIDAFVFPSGGYTDSHRTLNTSSTTHPVSEEFAQIPPSGFTFPLPTAAIVNRSQRSPKKKKKNKKARGQNCQEQDITRKAYRANDVVLAKAVSVSSDREKTYQVTFKVMKSYKRDRLFDSQIRLNFLPDKRPNRSRIDCETENENVLVKINIIKNKLYVLFLKVDGTHNYSALGTPLIFRTGKKKQERMIEKVCKKDFAPTLKVPKLTEKSKNSTSLKIVCTAKGFPIPLISWKLNDTVLQHNKSRTKIAYLRRNSTLTIRNPEFGRYQCVTSSADGKTTEGFVDYLPKSNKSEGTKCNETYITTYCQNGGSCYVQQPISEMYCVCAEGFSGRQCEEKSRMESDEQNVKASIK